METRDDRALMISLAITAGIIGWLAVTALMKGH